MNVLEPPILQEIAPIQVGKRWFLKYNSFGLYESGGIVAPNVTSILNYKIPFEDSRWIESEHDIDMML